MKPIKVHIAAEPVYKKVSRARNSVRKGYYLMGFVLGYHNKNREINIGLREAKLVSRLCHLTFTEILCQEIDHEMVHALASGFRKARAEERFSEAFRSAGAWARR